MEPNQRLKQSRIEAGYKTAADFAKKVGVCKQTYRSHEAPSTQKNHRTFDHHTARIYASNLGVDCLWLLFGRNSEQLNVGNGLPQHLDQNAIEHLFKCCFLILGGLREYLPDNYAKTAAINILEITNNGPVRDNAVKRFNRLHISLERLLLNALQSEKSISVDPGAVRQIAFLGSAMLASSPQHCLAVEVEETLLRHPA